MAFLDGFVQKVNKATQTVTTKAKDNMEITRLASAGRNLSSQLERVCTQIGHAYVESDGRAVDELKALSSRARELMAQLEELERQKLQVRNQNRCPNCGAVTIQHTRFCSNCGAKLPESPTPGHDSAPASDAQPDLDSNLNSAPAGGADDPTFDE